MTFEARELSSELGAPILLATFALGPMTWRQVAADQDVAHGGNTYTAYAGGMRASAVRESGEIRKNDLTLTVARDHPVAELWRVSPPTETLAVVLKEIHEDEAEDSTAWLGHVSNVLWNNEKSEAQIVLSPGAMAMGANGLRRLWQKGCPHVLYGPRCLLDKAAHQFAVTITDKVGLVLTGAEFASSGGKFHGGWVEWIDDDGITDRRFLTAHAGDTVTMLGQAPTLAVGTVVQAFEGCDHTLPRCDELGNVVHYGGIPYFLGKNPFDGSPVY